MTATLDNLAGQPVLDAHVHLACEATTSDQAIGTPTPMMTAPGRTHTPPDAAMGVPVPKVRTPCREDQNTPTPAQRGSKPTAAAPGSASHDDRQPAATRTPTPIADAPRVADLSDSPAAASRGTTPMLPALLLADPLLALAADVLDDLERVRIANENRLRQLTRDETDVDGEERGFGLTLDHPDVARLAALVEALAKAEHDAELQLKRTLRRHPLGAWVKQARGVGEKQAARLLASIGDPYWNDLHNRPRTVSELWAYCGYHVLRTGHLPGDTQAAPAGSAQTPAGHEVLDVQPNHASGISGNPDQSVHDTHGGVVGVAAHRSRGQRANWSADAKMRAHLVAVSIVKAGGPYREFYDQARAKYEGTLHPSDCKRCGPAGKPALAGSPRSAGHQHAMALRVVAKEVLKDLWREAKRLHDIHDGHREDDTQRAVAVVDTTPPGEIA